MKKTLLASLSLAAALVAPSAFANDVTAAVSANVPQQCEIVSVDDVSVGFNPGQSSTNYYGNIMIRCNLDQAFSLSVAGGYSGSTADRFTIQTADLHNMEVAVTYGNTGTTPWILGSSGAQSEIGTGDFQYVDYGLTFNPDNAILPAVGDYNGTATFSLTAL